MMLIFPFEEKIYEEHEIPATYVGHPLKERVKVSLIKKEFLQKYGFDPDKKLIALLPGSRKSELKYHMPVLLEALKKIKKEYPVQFVLILAESLDENLLAGFIPLPLGELKVITDDRYEAMAFSSLALCACGTANLEAALLETPIISFYRISPLSYHAGVRFVKIKDYSIVNILAGKRIIPELIQKRFTPENIFQEAKKLLESEEARSEMIEGFRRVKHILGEKNASKNAAQELEKLIKKRTI
jgi:lipid-A-disaccharide synthase